MPQTVGLPHDPRAHLFDYYKLLSCIPIFDGKHIIISIRVPLVEYLQQFDIFRAYSLPVPYFINGTQVKDCAQSGLQICNVKNPIRMLMLGLIVFKVT